MTRIIGITGGIGSGKSTLAMCFAAHNIPVFDADAISRGALTPGSEVLREAVALFGPEAVRADGTADRAYIASRVFSDPTLRQALNDLIHPYVIREMVKRTEECGEPIAAWDVPLLFESGMDAFCACTVAVLCSEEIRVERAVQRDGANAEQVRTRIRAQLSDDERKRLATYTIRNEGTVAAFCAEADRLIDLLKEELS